MQRRTFLRLAAGVAATWPTADAVAQKDTGPPLIAMLVPGGAEFARQRVEAVRAGLKEMGLVEGNGYTLALRFAGGDFSRPPGLARELDGLKPRVFVRTMRDELPNAPLVFTSFAAGTKAGVLATIEQSALGRVAPRRADRQRQDRKAAWHHRAGDTADARRRSDRMRRACRIRGNDDNRPRNQSAAFRFVIRAARIRCRGGPAGLSTMEGSER